MGDGEAGGVVGSRLCGIRYPYRRLSSTTIKTTPAAEMKTPTAIPPLKMPDATAPPAESDRHQHQENPAGQ